MMSFSYENQGTYTYLVYAISPEDNVDTMSLGMLTNNKIPGLASAIFTQMDATKYIKYNVSSKISVKQFFNGQVNKKRLIGVFSGIIDAMLSAEDYMIDTNSILLDLDYIFTDVSTCETVLICLPISNSENKALDLGTFFKTIMFSTQFDQTENCDHVAKIMNYLNSTPVFSLADFKKVLESISGTQTQTVSPKQTNIQNSNTPVNTASASPEAMNGRNSASQQSSTQPVTTNKQPITTPSISQQPVIKQQPVVPQTVTQSTASAGTEKKITAFGLLMHYSKENAELYKKQKAEKKGVPSQMSTPKSSASFAVPGTSNQGFAIPGQQTPVTPSTQPKVNNSTVQTPASTSAPASTPSYQPAYQPPAQPKGQGGNFGETTVLGGGTIGETTVLNAVNPAQAVSPHLIRLKNNEKIPLNKPVFRIGKERSYVDYFIGDNTAISRSHCNFITRDGEYFVVDTNSTNHTFVNGTMIQSNDEVKINHGDKIRLANEDFDFKLY